MRDWLERNAQPLQAIGALATAMAAVTAVIVVPYQVSQADQIQRDQTAREIYREYLNITIQNPGLAEADYCLLSDDADTTRNQNVSATAYSAYVDYLIYTTEQMVDTSAEWRAPMAGYLGQHMGYLCASESPASRDPDVRDLLADLGLVCGAVSSCD